MANITTIDNGGNGNARFSAYYGNSGATVGYGATRREAKADLQRKALANAQAAVGCRCNHRGEEGLIESVRMMAEPMLAVRFGARVAVLRLSEIGRSTEVA